MLCVWLVFCSLIVHTDTYGYVNPAPNTVTVFEVPAQVYLAHNFEPFFQIHEGDELIADGTRYTVTRVWEADRADITYQDWMEWYGTPGHVLLQTCVDAWGNRLLYVWAE